MKFPMHRGAVHDVDKLKGVAHGPLASAIECQGFYVASAFMPVSYSHMSPNHNGNVVITACIPEEETGSPERKFCTYIRVYPSRDHDIHSIPEW